MGGKQCTGGHNISKHRNIHITHTQTQTHQATELMQKYSYNLQLNIYATSTVNTTT
jgi:hypothetical protein